VEKVILTSPVAGISVLEVLGHGGFSVVYRGRQESVGREVALKVDNRMVRDDRDRRRFLRESHAAGRLSDHPNVISVFDAGITDDGRPYLVMELCTAGSLADRLRKDGPLPPPDVREVGVRIADALEAAHQAGVLHRDLKPANILVNRFGSPGLADFGLAASHDPTRQLSATLEALTPAYAAPEMFRMERPTTAVDVYGLGATLYSLLSGRPPRWPADGYPSIATIIDLQNEPVPDLPGVPSALIAVLRKAMANDPAERYESAAVFRDALKGVALDAPTGMFTAIPAEEQTHASGNPLPTTPSVRGSASVWGQPAVGSASIPKPPSSPTPPAEPKPSSPAAPTAVPAPTAVAPPVRNTAPVAPARPNPARPAAPASPNAAPARRKRRWPVVMVVLVLAMCGIGGGGVVAASWLLDRVSQTTGGNLPDPGNVEDTGGGPTGTESDVPITDATEAPTAAPTTKPSATPTPEAPYQGAEPSTITSVGLGPFRVDEPVKPLLDNKVARRPTDGDEGPCDPDLQLEAVASRYKDVRATQDGDLISYVRIRNDNYGTRSGVRVGSSEEKVRSLNDVEETTAPDAETKGFLVRDGGMALLFITNDGAVTEILVGRRSELTRVSGSLPGKSC
jgi:serine/threonine protein kinase